MSTERLYYSDPYAVTFSASILEKNRKDNDWEIVLDKTCFYPEGGGQPADKGTLDGIAVKDVRKTEGRICHYLPECPAGEIVQGKIDWNWRFDYMQQHTGQHLVSAALLKQGDYPTVSVHQGADITTIEVETLDIPESDLLSCEATANDFVNANVPVKCLWTRDDKLAEYSLRRPAKQKGDIRLVSIKGIDLAACGGVHCGRTGEVGMIKYVGTEKIRGRIRTIWKIGRRALADYHAKLTIISELGMLFSCRQPEIADNVRRLLSERQKLATEVEHLETELIAREAHSLASENRDGYLTLQFEERPADAVKKLLLQLMAINGTKICLVNRKNGRLTWSIGTGPDIDPVDLNLIRGKLLPLIDGKGGGKPPMYQGAGNNPAGAAAFLKAFRKHC